MHDVEMTANPTLSGHRSAIIACAALHRELRTVLAPFGDAITVELLPANLHNRPEKIPAAVERLITRLTAEGVEHISVAYADCGTGGLLDRVLERHEVQRLPGAHCYEFFAGTELFAELSEAELGTFYLTDYLALHFEALVWQGLGLDRHPELRDAYFGHYTRLLWLSQSENSMTEQKALAAAKQLGLPYDRRHTGMSPFSSAVISVVGDQRTETRKG
jgi:Protein of unknown function (DUF1638)